MPVLRLTLLGIPLAVCRIPHHEPVPDWAGDGDGFLSVTRTEREHSLVCAERLVPPGVVAERGWRAFEVQGPLDFGLTGVLASISGALADAGIPVFVVSTYDTDYVLVREGDVDGAVGALRGTGHVLPD